MTAAESKEGSFLFWECAEYTEVCIRTSGLAKVCIFEFYTLFTPDLTLVIHLQPQLHIFVVSYSPRWYIGINFSSDSNAITLSFWHWGFIWLRAVQGILLLWGDPYGLWLWLQVATGYICIHKSHYPMKSGRNNGGIYLLYRVWRRT